ncbi:hypothetical protein J7T55_003604 [Diaporthe amygdali]|uniref:uncharacterized protein n=1 Tax=Phomopsis amygdali TaxID=1214568 RepID=UPI0022FEDF5B|nr:uncharacterized protein J7T55_003604 [Diaporthe amygdali]KAJ0117187.1 hypothetical protein J7T55_003604 [Diaporthe amygdali]
MHGYKHPPSWRLWHPNQGVVFQQPLYPVLDVARFFTEASAVENISTGPDGSGKEMINTSFKNLGKFNADSNDNLAAPEVHKAPLAEEPPSEAPQESSTHPTEACEPALREEEAQAEVVDEPSRGPPFTPLDYKIPEESFSAAMAAVEGTPESFWTYAMYRGPSDNESGREGEAKVKVHYCKSAHTAERVCQYFLKEKVIGFDLEWSMEAYRSSSPRKNVSLVQLASQSRVALLHLALFPEKDRFVVPTLKRIMEDPGITKTGVWIKGDCTRLRKFLGIESRGVFELSHLYRQVKYTRNGRHDLINKKLVSLANQVQDTMHLPLFKGQDVRSSDWSKSLGMDQIVYSASDAYAAVHLYAMLNYQRESLDPTPPLPFHVEHEQPIPLAPGIESSSSDESDAEEEELEAIADAGYGASILTPEQLEALGETIQIEAGEEDSNDSKATAEAPKAAKPKSRSTTAAAKPATPQKDPRIVAAETWLMEYKATRPGGKTKAAAAALRAYFIWHANDDLSVDSIAQLLRDPPLQLNTVCGYILEAVKVEKLSYDPARLRAVLNLYPQEQAQRRFAALFRATANVSVP